jgi:hypothetical protein
VGKKALSLSKIFESIRYEPHQVQRSIHAAARTSRFRVVCAGRRTGKSTLGGHELTAKAIAAYYRTDLDPFERRSEHWIVGPEYTDAEKEFRVLWGDLQRLGIPLDKPGSYYDPIGGNMHVKLWGGRFQVHCKSAKYPDTLVGEGLESVILAEAAKLKPIVWSKYLRPTLADYAREGYGDALMTSTPEGKNWFYEMWQVGQARTNGFWSIRMPSWANNIVFPEGRYDPEIISMGIGMVEEKFKQEIGAEFTEYVGRVFKDFDEESHVADRPYNSRWPLYVCTDYGFTNPNVALFVQHDVWDNVWVCGEYYQVNRTPEEFARDVAEDPVLGAMLPYARMLYPDPEDPGASATLAQKWRLPIGGNTGGRLQDRLDLIRRWVGIGPEFIEFDKEHPEWVPRLMIDRSCINLIREMQDYRYPETKSELNGQENPMKKDDHAPEALGRFFGGHYSHTVAGNKARQSTAKVRSQNGR